MTLEVKPLHQHNGATSSNLVFGTRPLLFTLSLLDVDGPGVRHKVEVGLPFPLICWIYLDNVIVAYNSRRHL